MSSPYTVDLLGDNSIAQVPQGGFWYETRQKPSALFRVARIFGLAFSFATSPLTAIADPWLIEKKRRDGVVTVSVYQEIVSRSISRSEALRLARQILEQAEGERIAVAESEAARGIQWGDDL